MLCWHFPLMLWSRVANLGCMVNLSCLIFWYFSRNMKWHTVTVSNSAAQKHSKIVSQFKNFFFFMGGAVLGNFTQILLKNSKEKVNFMGPGERLFQWQISVSSPSFPSSGLWAATADRVGGKTSGHPHRAPFCCSLRGASQGNNHATHMTLVSAGAESCYQPPKAKKIQ